MQTTRAILRTPRITSPDVGAPWRGVGSVLLAGLAGALLCAPAGAQEPSSPADSAQGSRVPEAESFVRVGSGGARLRNLSSRDGVLLEELRAGTVLAVVRENVGWLEVEVPGGFRAWTFGEYLRATETEGVWAVTRNAVFLRPLPTSDVSSFPLSKRLHAGDRVQVIDRHDPAIPMDEDWVRIWSPEGATAWVLAGETEALPEGAEPALLWATALATLGPKPRIDLAPQAAEELPEEPQVVQPLPKPSVAAAEALAQADAALAFEQAREAPDYARVRGAYEAVLAIEPEGPSADQARRGLGMVEALEAGYSIESVLEEERLRLERELIRRQREIWDRARAKDPFGQVYDGRGILQRRVLPGEEARYFLSWRGEDVCELLCSSGRYDLEVFAGHNLGALGEVVAGISLEEGAERATPPRIDVHKLAVLAPR